ncbi:sensor domain-containing diguanylate cyclase [Blastococcus atacamensis]|uniref:sensor domain-containing diguanylate cyclase n=1 Tax=Blastococcus atacamensis TaxID=2070508 RepID=UPI000CECC4B9|nr:sensor domain-containing diguanylate cyclase [Blastococcus atacamensis]
MTGSPAPTARAAWLHAALAVLAVGAIVTVVPMGPGRPAAEVVLFLLGILAVRTAVVVHGTPLRTAWLGLGLGLGFFTLSCLAEVLELAGIAPEVSGTVESALDIAAYAAVVAGALGVVRRDRRRRDRESWTDTATLLLAAALALVAVRAGQADPMSADLVEMGFGTPVITVVLLIVCVPLAMSRGARSASTMALLAAGVLTVAGYGGRLLADTPLRESALLDPLPLLAIAALVLAGRHPAAASMGRRPESDQDAASSRVLGLGAALLISPALLLLWGVRDGGAGYLVGAGSALLTGMALWRLVALNRERERVRAELDESQTRLELLLANSADVIGIVDADGIITYMSPAVESLLGRPASDYVGRTAIQLADPRDQARLRAVVASAGDAASGGVADTDIRVQHSSGGTRWVEMRISGRVDAVGIAGWVVNFREVTDRKLFEDELRRQARTDPLTGLLNRTAFNEQLAAATNEVDPAAPPAVLFVDVDDFKNINDTLGHAAGDELLLVVASRLSAQVRGGDVVARLGGDEFALLLTGADGERLRDVADRLLTAMRAPLEIAGRAVTVTASIGGALAEPGCSAERLLHRADTAMYTAKRAGKDSRALLDASEAVLA